MQEEIENRTVSFAVSSARLSARALLDGMRLAVRLKGNAGKELPGVPDARVRGKQTVAELIGQGQGASTIDIGKTELKGFERVARKYGIDYAVRKDRSSGKTGYLFFFKAKDTDALQAAYKEYAAEAMKKTDRRTRIGRLPEKAREAVRAAAPRGKIKHRTKERIR